MATLSKKHIFKSVISILLVAVLTTIPVKNVFAAPDHSLTFTMNNGGEWKYNGKTDTSVTGSWSSTDWRSALVVNKVIYMSPTTVKSKLYKAAKEVGVDQTLSVVKYGVEVAASSGVEIAKQKITTKFGTSIASKVIPILAVFSWTYTAVDLLSAVASGQKLNLLADAASKNKGLIYVNQRTTGDMSKWYYWDGSSSYGSYPYAKLGPNNWQYGDVTIY